MRDIIAGLLIIAYAMVFLVPGLEYGVGTWGRPGSGGLPVAAALVMIAFGLIVAVYGFRHRAAGVQAVRIDSNRIRHITFVSAGIIAFAMAIDRFGLIPAMLLLIVISALADKESRPLPTIILCAVMSLLVWLIFKVGLASTMPLFKGVF